MRRIPPSVQLFDDLIAALFGRLGKEKCSVRFPSAFLPQHSNVRKGMPVTGIMPMPGISRSSSFVFSSGAAVSHPLHKEQVIVHPHANHVLRTLGFKIPVGLPYPALTESLPLVFCSFQPCISTIPNQCVNTFSDLIPTKRHILTTILAKLYALCIVPFFAVRAFETPKMRPPVPYSRLRNSIFSPTSCGCEKNNSIRSAPLS